MTVLLSKDDIQTGDHATSMFPGERSYSVISADAIERVMNLLVDTYEFPIHSMIRETFSNAYDATVEARKQGLTANPPSITLPTLENPYLVIKDNGVGMDATVVEENYKNIGSSSKRDNLDVIGAYGAGAKSPLAYCRRFEVSTVKDGYKHHFYFGMSEDNRPHIEYIYRGETNDERGTVVTIPVESRHHDKVRNVVEDNYVKYCDMAFYLNGELVDPGRFNTVVGTIDLNDGQANLEIVFRSDLDGLTVYEIIKKLQSAISSHDKITTTNPPIAVLGGWEYNLGSSIDEASDFLFIRLIPGVVSFTPSREAIKRDERLYDVRKIIADTINEKGYDLYLKVFSDALIKYDKDTVKAELAKYMILTVQIGNLNNGFMRNGNLRGGDFSDGDIDCELLKIDGGKSSLANAYRELFSEMQNVKAVLAGVNDQVQGYVEFPDPHKGVDQYNLRYGGTQASMNYARELDDSDTTVNLFPVLHALRKRVFYGKNTVVSRVNSCRVVNCIVADSMKDFLSVVRNRKLINDIAIVSSSRYDKAMNAYLYIPRAHAASVKYLCADWLNVVDAKKVVVDTAKRKSKQVSIANRRVRYSDFYFSVSSGMSGISNILGQQFELATSNNRLIRRSIAKFDEIVKRYKNDACSIVLIAYPYNKCPAKFDYFSVYTMACHHYGSTSYNVRALFVEQSETIDLAQKLREQMGCALLWTDRSMNPSEYDEQQELIANTSAFDAVSSLGDIDDGIKEYIRAQLESSISGRYCYEVNYSNTQLPIDNDIEAAWDSNSIKWPGPYFGSELVKGTEILAKDNPVYMHNAVEEVLGMAVVVAAITHAKLVVSDLVEHYQPKAPYDMKIDGTSAVQIKQTKRIHEQIKSILPDLLEETMQDIKDTCVDELAPKAALMCDGDEDYFRQRVADSYKQHVLNTGLLSSQKLLGMIQQKN